MKPIFSKKLKHSDTIAIISPASSVKSFKPKNIIKKSVALLNTLGFKVTFGKYAYENDLFNSSSIKSRVNDLHNAFKNKKISGILCARGGFNSNDLLPYINWKLIKQNPKPLIGYSDITVLANAIYAKTGLVTYIGPTFSTLGSNEEKKNLDYIVNYFLKCLTNENAFIIESSKYFKERKIKIRKNVGAKVFQNGIAEGIIIGGNLCSLNLLQGTDYMPSLKNAILFIEDDDFGGSLTPLEFSRNLESLLQLKDAETVRGIVFGRFNVGAKMTTEKMKFILSTKRISKNIPIIYNADFGHTMPMFTFPIGGTTKIIAKNNKASIEIVKH